MDAIRIAVDVGGTFTDLVVADEDGRLHAFKAPSTPADPARAVFHALDRAAAAFGVTGHELLAGCQSFVHGTTVATNAMVQRAGARLGMLTTAGFRDVLAVRRGKRALMWDYRSPYPPELVERSARLGVRERIDHRGRPQTPLHEDDVRRACRLLREDGIEALLVCFLNSYLNDAHERRAAEIARREIPDIPVFCSAEVLPVMGEYERFSTTAVNAYVAPRTVQYLRRLHEDLVAGGLVAKFLVMESTGGVLDLPLCEERPVLTVLSGPAAAAPAAQLFGWCLDEANLVLFDMGGTSCDVVLVKDGAAVHTDELQVAGYDIALPAVDVSTIGAGGGTVAWVDSGGFLRVGPRSAGADPGPACYGRGGLEPTVTDANLVLGRLNARNFLGGEIGLDEVLARRAIEEHCARPLGLTVAEAALAIVRVVNQIMIEAIKVLSLERGHDPRKFVLAAAGGAGGLHAGALARELEMPEAYVARHAAVCCTLGMLHSDIRHDLLQSFFARLGPESVAEAARHLEALRRSGEERLRSEGFTPAAMEFRPALGLRYAGQQSQIAIDVPWPLVADAVPAIATRFHERHEALYGSRDLATHIEIVDVRLTAIGPTPRIKLWQEPMPAECRRRESSATRLVVFDDAARSVDAAVHDGRGLVAGDLIAGPAIIEEPTTTILVARDEVVRVDRFGNYRLSRTTPVGRSASGGRSAVMAGDRVTMTVLERKLDSIAREMGVAMRRAARSPIFSQSHDFSCFLTDGRGQLISIAEGIPIHTGGGGLAVRRVLEYWGDDIHPGDVFLSNDPYEGGGNHLPDWTVMNPVFHDGALVGFANNRAHQVDIGGGMAGTYNSNAVEIFDEGIRLLPVKIYERGHLRRDLWDVIALNTRSPKTVQGDVAAMVGSTRIGARRLGAILDEYGRQGTLAYFDAILDHAERMMRDELARIPDGTYVGADEMNNDVFTRRPVPIIVTITIAGSDVTVDFTGTAPQMRGFKNSSMANTQAAVYMALATLVDPAIPKNEGMFRPITIVAPRGTVVNPEPPAPLTYSTVYPAIHIIHACWKALAPTMPERASAGWGATAYPTMSGYRDGEGYVMYHWLGSSGAGAIAGRDGFDVIGSLNTLGGLTLPNVELYEQIYPAHFIRWECREDGGGAGEYRGGTGCVYTVRITERAKWGFRGEGCDTPTGFGVGGGQPGKAAITMLDPGTAAQRDAPQYAIVDLPASEFSMASAGGGGWGSPLHRNPVAVRRDVRNGMVSLVAARDVYGVILDPATDDVDAAATAQRRCELAAASAPRA